MVENTFSKRGARVSALVLLWAVRAVAQSPDFKGEIALGEHNCVACHDAPDAVKARLASRAAPVIGAQGMNITPQWLRAFLADPQSVKPGTIQPDMLASLSGQEKSDAVEALTHYLVSLHGGARNYSDSGAEEIATGRGLYHRIGCVACHAPSDPPAKAAADDKMKSEIAKLAKKTVPFGDLARKATVRELAGFLQNPLKTHPSGRMPSMKLSAGEAHAIAAYLLRDQISGDMKKTEGLKVEYFDAGLASPEAFDARQPTTTGKAAKISTQPRQRNSNFSLRFMGSIAIPKDGEYKFFTTSDDGSWLYIDGRLIVDNGGLRPATEKQGSITLTAGEHAFACLYFDGGGEIALSASWEGPGIEKSEIPPEAFNHGEGAMKPVGAVEFAVDPAKAAKGKELFASMNCAACHQIDQPGTKSAKALASLDLHRADGCLGANVAKGLPKFAISDVDRDAMRATLANVSALEKPLPPAQQVERTMTAMNCFACHNRGEHAGPQGLRREYFTAVGEVDLGEEGRMPPHLNGVGGKLKMSWLTNVLFQARSVRPYIATRMPMFGEENLKSLPDALVKTDLPLFKAQVNPVSKDANAQHGRKLVGTGGLSCIVCHNFNGHASLGVPALDMATMSERLRYEWFHEYVLNPQSLRPGTRMPGFWPDGKASNKSILNGDTEAQIGSVWEYLSHVKGARMPAGLEALRMDLVADTEAVIYRNFIDGCGPRGIGVGYPEKANLAFDADFVNIALLWQGAFMDAAHHRNGRGAGSEPPLGENVLRLKYGAPFAVLADTNAPWPSETWRSADCKFKGYKLDAEQRPAFLYSFRGEAAIADYPVAIAEAGAPAGFKRTLTLIASKKPVANLYFRAAFAKKIEIVDGKFVADDHLKICVQGGGPPLIRKAGDMTELVVPVAFKGSKAVIVEDLSW